MGGTLPNPNPFADLAREQVNQFIGLEPEPEVDLEFKVYTIKWIDGAGPVDPYNKHSQEIEKILNDGWQLDDKIISPPFVMLIFSREKEEKEAIENGE